MTAGIDGLLTSEARSRIGRMLGAVAASADMLERRYREALAASGPGPVHEYDQVRIRALMGITPAAASRTRRLAAFFEQVNSEGRRLAKLNLTPEDAHAALDIFGGLLTAVLGDEFQPAREQLRLATVLALAQAFYEVRETETQALFSLYRAGAEASCLEDGLRRIVRASTLALRARAGRLLHEGGDPSGGAEGRLARRKLARPLYIAKGGAGDGLVDRDLLTGGYACYWSYPVDGQTALQFGFSTARRWLPRELTLLGAAAASCTAAMEKASLEDEVRRLRAEALRAEQEERRRIGRELHDETCQSLLALRLELEMMERGAPETSAARLRAARQIAERTVVDLRRAIAALSPAVLERLGLPTALRRLGERALQGQDCKLRLRISGACEGLSRQQEETVYRVAQESLRNCAKHAGATRVNLSLQSSDKRIRLRISDNGAGFGWDIAKSKPMAFGLAGMRERAALMGGTLAVRSAPGKGAAIVLELPPAAAPVKAGPARDDVKDTGTSH